MYFFAIGEAEPRDGFAILPAGRRQTALASAIEAILREDFVDIDVEVVDPWMVA